MEEREEDDRGVDGRVGVWWLGVVLGDGGVFGGEEGDVGVWSGGNEGEVVFGGEVGVGGDERGEEGEEC